MRAVIGFGFIRLRVGFQFPRRRDRRFRVDGGPLRQLLRRRNDHGRAVALGVGLRLPHRLSRSGSLKAIENVLKGGVRLLCGF